MLRNKRFDEAKGILILLVVFGHLIEPQISNSLPVRRVYEFIYLFHMPAFVFISGYLFKIESETRTHCVRIIQNLVMPLVMFEAIYEGYTILTTGRPSVYFLGFAPYWTLWYLLSLIFWSIALPLVQTLRALISIPIFIALALAIGYSSNIGMQFSLSRTFYFFPFFLSGHVSSSNDIFADLNRSSPQLKVVILGLFLALLLSVFLYSDIDVSVLYGSSGYGTNNLADLRPLVIRMAILAIGFIASFAIIEIFPLGLGFLAKFGQNSLAIFLIHGLIVRILTQFGIVSLGYMYGDVLGLFFTLLVSVLLCFGLSFPRITLTIRSMSVWLTSLVLNAPMECPEREEESPV